MAILSRVAHAAIAATVALAIPFAGSAGMTACYSPDVRDCTITCTPGTSCGDGQVCGSDGLCAAPDVTCGSGSGTDTDGIDASTATTVQLHITITSQGRVSVNTTQICDTAGSDKGDCTFAVPSHASASVVAMDTALGHPFSMWTAGCTGASPTCTVTPTADMAIGAAFR